MSKQTLSSDQARAALLRGVDAVANPVKVTLGPRGRNVMLDRPGQPLATRDGVTVAKEVSWLPDPFENMGAAYAREGADAAVTEAGDGTTTTTVLLQAIVAEGIRQIAAGAEPLALADGINKAAHVCAEYVRKQSVPATPELIEQVAIISTHGDVELGRMVASASKLVGEHGVVELAESTDHRTTVEHLEGFYFERGWRRGVTGDHLFVNADSGQRCVLNNPLILISERVIVGGLQNVQGDHIFTILQAAVTARRPLLIIAEDLTGDALNLFVTQVVSGTLPGGAFVKLPGFGETRSQAVHDLQIAIGARRIHSQASTSIQDQLSSFTPDDLGTCKQAIISATRTVLVEGAADPMRLTNRIGQLIQQEREASNPFEKEQLSHRVARLTGGVAVLKVGAHSEPAMIEKKARAEDAIHACRGALESGVVPGGGVALLRARDARFDDALMTLAGTEAAGMNLLLKAMTSPMRQIAANAGLGDGSAVVEKTLEHSDSWGYNAATGEYGDLFEAGVVDPTKVVVVALLKAASIGALLLTTEALVTDVPEHAPAPGAPKYDVRG